MATGKANADFSEKYGYAVKLAGESATDKVNTFDLVGAGDRVDGIIAEPAPKDGTFLVHSQPGLQTYAIVAGEVAVGDALIAAADGKLKAATKVVETETVKDPLPDGLFAIAEEAGTDCIVRIRIK